MHGGDIYRNKVKYDFSVNINPLGMPGKVKKALKKNIGIAQNYPDEKCQELLEILCRTIKKSYDADFGEASIAFGNGASELIPGILRAAKSKKVLLVAPGFLGYKAAVDSVSVEADAYCLLEENDFELGMKEAEEILEQIKLNGNDCLILTNPNNPNGKLMEPQVLEKIIAGCTKMDVLLVLDECFMELTGKAESHSMIPMLKDTRTVILRAFTKTFAIPGLRLGYCLCKNPELIQAIKKQLPEWNVSGIAQLAGVKALEQKNYIYKGCVLIRNQRKILMQKLKSLELKVYDSDVNFILFKSSILDLRERLLKKQISIRDCSDYDGLQKGYYRIAVKSKKENKKLIEALKEVLENE